MRQPIDVPSSRPVGDRVVGGLFTAANLLLAPMQQAVRWASQGRRPYYGAVLVCLALSSLLLISPYRHYQDARSQRDELHAEIVTLEQRRVELTRQVASLHTDEGLELEMRRQLGYVTGREIAYIVVPAR